MRRFRSSGGIVFRTAPVTGTTVQTEGLELLPQVSTGKRNGERKSKREKLRAMIDARLKAGKAFSEIMNSANLNETERKVVDIYIMTDKEMKVREVAERIGRKHVTVTLTLMKIENKLQGRDPLYHLKKKYYQMSKKQLKEAVAATGVKNRRELQNHNAALWMVALDRGVLDDILPKRCPDNRTELRNLIAGAGGKKKRRILEVLEPEEKEVFDTITRNDRQRLKVMADGDKTVHTTIRRLIGMLKGEYEIKQTRKLRSILRKLGTEEIEEAKKGMNERELKVLELRGLAGKPERMTVIAEMFGMTREGARIIEKEVLKKLENIGKN